VADKPKNTTPATALAAAVAIRDDRATALDGARADVQRIVSEWRAGIDTTAAADKRAAEGEVEKLELLLAAADREVERARKALPAHASPSSGARELVGAVTRAVAEATTYSYDGPLGPMDDGRRMGLATYSEAIETSVGTDGDGNRKITITARLVGHPTVRNGKWSLSDVEPQIVKALAAQVGTSLPGLGVVQVADALGTQVRENAGAARDRDGVHVVGGRSDRSMVDALAVSVRFVAVEQESDAVEEKPKPSPRTSPRTAVDPRERRPEHPGNRQ
jgi:hypothetical protein